MGTAFVADSLMSLPCPITKTQTGMYAVHIKYYGRNGSKRDEHCGFYTILEDADLAMRRGMTRCGLDWVDYKEYEE